MPVLAFWWTGDPRVAYPAAADGATRVLTQTRAAGTLRFRKSAAPALPRTARRPSADVAVSRRLRGLKSMMMIRRTRLLLAATLVLAACGKDEQPAGVIPADKFVAANVAVRS